jgi:hypothetical protein
MTCHPASRLVRRAWTYWRIPEGRLMQALMAA